MFKQSFSSDPQLFTLLGEEIYNDINRPFIELISNSYDACAKNVTVNININTSNLDETYIMISDDGMGMDKDILNSRFFKISNSNQQPLSINCKRKRKGSKGIGRLSGFVLGTNLNYKSVKDGIEYSFKLNENELKEYEDISDININIEEKITKEKDGVQIFITNLKHLLISDDELKQRLIQNFGYENDFNIKLNGSIIEAEDIDGEKEKFNIDIENYTLNGWIAISSKPLSSYGMLIKQNTKAIGTPMHLGSEISKDIQNKLYGVIDISEIKEIKANASWDNIFDDQIAKELKNKLKDVLREKANTIMDNDIELEYKSNIAIPEISNRLNRLPSFAKKAAERTIKNSMKILKYKRSELAKTIMELSIKSYEQNEVYEILKKINEAKQEDITKLASAFRLWGVKEIADVIVMIQHRLQVLDAFEQMINEKSTPELKGTHEFLKNNMWIIDERYEWYISNQTLRTIANRLLDEKYTGENENKRPDLFIKMQQNTHTRNEFFILELKRPSHPIKFEDKIQGERYASVISDNYTKEAFFNVYIVGSEYEKGIQRESISGNVRTITMSYHELAHDAKARMEFIQKNLKENEQEIEEDLYS